MKITTGSIKSTNYEENHELYVGTHTGTFKRIDITNEDNPYRQVNLQTVEALNKDSRVTCLNWGNEEKTEILIGRANKFVKIYDVNSNDFTSNLEMDDGPIVGLARCDGSIVAGIGTGKIQILSDKPNPTIMDVGNNLSRLRQCPYEKKLIATGGKERENRLKIWDIETQKNTFISKNVPHDFLQLEVPVWDNDFGFFDSNCLATCSRHGYIRTYDTRKQRRPVLKFESKDQISFSCLAIYDKMIYVGTTTGGMRGYDSRNLKNHVHTFKGFTGTVSDITVDPTGKFLCSSSLDRFVRIHNAEEPVLLYQAYVKSKGTSILIKSLDSKLNETDDCVILNDSVLDVADDIKVTSNRRIKGDATNRNEKDEEYDQLFQNMETVEDGDLNLGDEPPKKKSKFKRKKSKLLK